MQQRHCSGTGLPRLGGGGTAGDAGVGADVGVGVGVGAAVDVAVGVDAQRGRAYKGRLYRSDDEGSCTKRPSRTRRHSCASTMRRLPRVSFSSRTTCPALRRVSTRGHGYACAGVIGELR